MKLALAPRKLPIPRLALKELGSQTFQIEGKEFPERGILFPVQYHQDVHKWVDNLGLVNSETTMELLFHPQCTEGPKRLETYISRSGKTVEQWLKPRLRDCWRSAGFRLAVFFPRDFPGGEQWAAQKGPSIRQVAFTYYHESGKKKKVGALFARSPRDLWEVAQNVEWLRGTAEALRWLRPEGLFAFFAVDHADFPGFDPSSEGDYPC